LPRPRDAARAAQIASALRQFDASVYRLLGIRAARKEEALIEQILESLHRVEYVSRIRQRPLSPSRQNPHSDAFDPVKAAILHQNAGQLDDAFWMVFLFVHFGKNLRTGWLLARDVYGALGGQPWTWARVSRNAGAFRQWLSANQATLKGGDGVARRFGNHRKYVSLSATKPAGTGAAVETYVAWVGPTGTHQTRIQQALQRWGGDPQKTFDDLYRSMRTVKSFGRTARFDYLTMVGKLGLAPIQPGSTYMQGATGPLDGARLLFGDNNNRLTRAQVDARLVQLSRHTGLGMQVLEDSICNWQKSPSRFVRFRG
jgi:hypothetical protein